MFVDRRSKLPGPICKRKTGPVFPRFGNGAQRAARGPGGWETCVPLGRANASKGWRRFPSASRRFGADTRSVVGAAGWKQAIRQTGGPRYESPPHFVRAKLSIRRPCAFSQRPIVTGGGAAFPEGFRSIPLGFREILSGFNGILPDSGEILPGFGEILSGFNEILPGFGEILSGFHQILSGFRKILSGFCEILTGFCKILTDFRVLPDLPASIRAGGRQKTAGKSGRCRILRQVRPGRAQPCKHWCFCRFMAPRSRIFCFS